MPTNEIELRAWDKEAHQWLEGLTYTLHTSGRLFTTPPNVELTQWTGLLDKNGKKIYGGDIVKGTNDIGAVTFLFAAWYVQMPQYKILLSEDIWEIIGNIYEQEVSHAS